MRCAVWGWDDENAHEGVGEDVAPRLVEELVGEGEVPLVHVLGVGEVRDIGGAIRRAGGDDGGSSAFERLAETQETGAAHAPGPMGWPACGPGV